MYDSLADAIEFAFGVILLLGMAAFGGFLLWIVIAVLFTF